MEAWIKSLLNLAPSSVSTFAAGVRDRLLAFFSWVNRVLTGAFSGWGKLATALGAARNWVVWSVGEAYLTLKWLKDVRIPALISAADATVRKWVTAGITVAKTELKALVTTLDKWAKSAVNTVTGALTSFRTWATKELASLLTSLTYVRNLVVAFLTSPTRLASWLAAAMMRELWLYADRNADKIITWARRKSLAYTIDTAKRIEQMIGRLL